MEPGTGAEEASPQQPPENRRKWAVVAILVALAAVVGAVALPGLLAGPSQGTMQPASATPPETTVIPSSPGTPAYPAAVSIQATPAETGEAAPSPAPVPNPSPSGPPGFTVTITPAQTTAQRGETVTYQITIEPQNGFSEPIHMELVASVLFFRQTYDLGTQEPPYPKTFDYAFTVPGSLPSGATVSGVVTSTGGGISREDQLSLTVQ